METKKIFSSLEARLKDVSEYHCRTEHQAAVLLTMMKKKTELYGGNPTTGTMKQKLAIAHYEGVNRKARRANHLVELILTDAPNSEDALVELYDTWMDIAGYVLIALNDMEEYFE